MVSCVNEQMLGFRRQRFFNRQEVILCFEGCPHAAPQGTPPTSFGKGSDIRTVAQDTVRFVPPVNHVPLNVALIPCPFHTDHAFENIPTQLILPEPDVLCFLFGNSGIQQRQARKRVFPALSVPHQQHKVSGRWRHPGALELQQPRRLRSFRHRASGQGTVVPQLFMGVSSPVQHMLHHSRKFLQHLDTHDPRHHSPPRIGVGKLQLDGSFRQTTADVQQQDEGQPNPTTQHG